MRRMKPVLLLLLLVLLSTVAFSGCSRQAVRPNHPDGQMPQEEPIPVSERVAAPTFTLKDLFSGADVEFKADSAGRVRMLNFFSPG